MNYSIDRIENSIAVLISDEGQKLEVLASELAPNAEVGNIFILGDDGLLYFSKEQTDERKELIKNRHRRLFDKFKNK